MNVSVHFLRRFPPVSDRAAVLIPALVALGVGLLFGGLYVWRMRGSGPDAPAPEPPLAQRDLEGKRDVLLRQLVELDDAAAKRSPEQLARERYALEPEIGRAHG